MPTVPLEYGHDPEKFAELRRASGINAEQGDDTGNEAESEPQCPCVEEQERLFFLREDRFYRKYACGYQVYIPKGFIPIEELRQDADRGHAQGHGWLDYDEDEEDEYNRQWNLRKAQYMAEHREED
jgi:hypothetical protein